MALVQAVLNGLGGALAKVYDVIPSYGVAIILFTIAIRVLLLPLGIKQIRSMQAMQAIQPKVKALQQKYKGQREKLQEEMMSLYREHGVNPLGGCLPLLFQFPVLIALFAVLRVPGGVEHVPASSALHSSIVEQTSGVHFLGMNLLCSAHESGKTLPVQPSKGHPVGPIKVLRCGGGPANIIPYYVLALCMIGTTFYQQLQMQRASPGGATQQQQTLTRIMPLAFGVTGYFFPAGLVLYWTTTNLIQIGQQRFMLPRRGKGDEEAAGSGKADGGPSPRPGRPGKPSRGSSRTGGGSKRMTTGNASSGRRRRPSSQPRRRQTGGGSDGSTKRSSNGGNRKKRPER